MQNTEKQFSLQSESRWPVDVGEYRIKFAASVEELDASAESLSVALAADVVELAALR